MDKFVCIMWMMMIFISGMHSTQEAGGSFGIHSKNDTLSPTYFSTCPLASQAHQSLSLCTPGSLLRFKTDTKKWRHSQPFLRLRNRQKALDVLRKAEGNPPRCTRSMSHSKRKEICQMLSLCAFQGRCTVFEEIDCWGNILPLISSYSSLHRHLPFWCPPLISISELVLYIQVITLF